MAEKMLKINGHDVPEAEFLRYCRQELSCLVRDTSWMKEYSTEEQWKEMEDAVQLDMDWIPQHMPAEHINILSNALNMIRVSANKYGHAFACVEKFFEEHPDLAWGLTEEEQETAADNILLRTALM